MSDRNSVEPETAAATATSAAAEAAAAGAEITVRGAAAAGSSVVVSSAPLPATSAAPELPVSCSASTTTSATAAGRDKFSGKFPENFDEADNNAGDEQKERENRFITLKEAGLEPGASICFFRAGCGGRGKASVGRTYAEITEELVQRMHELLQGRGPLGRVHLLKVTAADAAAMGLLLVVYAFCCCFLMFCFVLNVRELNWRCRRLIRDAFGPMLLCSKRVLQDDICVPTKLP